MRSRLSAPLASGWTPVALACAWAVAQAGWHSADAQALTEAGAAAQATTAATAAAASPANADSAAAAASAPSTPASRMSFSLPAPRMNRRDGKLPLFFEADAMDGTSGERTHAFGSVRLRQGEMRVRANDLVHTQADNTARASGNVRIVSNGNLFTGPELTLRLDTLEGNFIRPHFWFARTQAGGQAELVEFLGENRLRAHRTSYSSCTPDDEPDGTPGRPDWELQTSQVDLDFDKSEGEAKNAVIRFMGVPLLAAPSLTFPLDNQRKSGFLPPSFYFDSASGFELSAPYYWNIAPNRDATIAPTLSARRGVGADLEFRYMEAQDTGKLRVFGLPEDKLRGGTRGLIDFMHKGSLGKTDALAQTTYDIKLLRASDDDFWKDFSHIQFSTTPRLYDSHANVETTLNQRYWGLGNSQTTFYGSVQSWQTLRDLDPKSDPTQSSIDTPYRREPQLGFRSRSVNDGGVVFGLQGEFNRFGNADPTKVVGNRVNANAIVERPFTLGGLNVLPRATLRSVSYDLDKVAEGNRRSATTVTPTFSLDSGFSMERSTRFFGRDLVQTLEPRVLYVYTPYHRQSDLPLFDSAPRDFNQYAVYTDNAYTGGDRISDANQVTVGVQSRLLDSKTGAEALRLGIAQKVLLADQRINPLSSQPVTQRLSDLLLQASTSVIPNWSVDSTVQYSAQNHQTEQGAMTVRYYPGTWRTVSATYRYTRAASEQVEIGWQWPFAGRTPPLEQVMTQATSPDLLDLNPRRPTPGGACGGTWYTVGRMTHSMRDKRVINSLVGVEYDAGCWIGRVVTERVALGSSKANTRVMFQLELLGLSQLALGANPLRVLKQNVPGYRLLRDEGKPLAQPGNTTPYSDE